jgi:RNA polymerase sigma factor (sigma-70 family)
MPTNGLRKALDYLRHTLTAAEADVSDELLLRRFVAERDGTSFALLVQRHGPMVLGVCSRILGHRHDAEDAFQAAFLVLARKAGSVVKRASLAGWLYAVAYRIALDARALNARRREMERQVEVMPQPPVAPAEPQDWQPLLDRELSRLPEKYRVPVILCDLEGRPRREVARQLSLPEGTLSSRLATARRMLASRLARYGLSLSGGLLAAALSEGASAAVPSSLVTSTVQAALLAAAGQLAASLPAAALMRGVLQSMFIAKLKLMAGAMMVVTALGATGLVYRAAGQPAPAEPRREGKPLSEVETLRRENELLKLNLEVVLEKVRAQEAELRALRGPSRARTGPTAPTPPPGVGPATSPPTPPTTNPPPPPADSPRAESRPPRMPYRGQSPASPQPRPRGADDAPAPERLPSDPSLVPPPDITAPEPRPVERRPNPRPEPQPGLGNLTGPRDAEAAPTEEVEDAVRALRKARDEGELRRALDALEKATKKLRRQLKEDGNLRSS